MSPNFPHGKKIQKPQRDTPMLKRSWADVFKHLLFWLLTPHSDRGIDLINWAERHISGGRMWLRKSRLNRKIGRPPHYGFVLRFLCSWMGIGVESESGSGLSFFHFDCEERKKKIEKGKQSCMFFLGARYAGFFLLSAAHKHRLSNPTCLYLKITLCLRPGDHSRMSSQNMLPVLQHALDARGIRSPISRAFVVLVLSFWLRL